MCVKCIEPEHIRCMRIPYELSHSNQINTKTLLCSRPLCGGCMSVSCRQTADVYVRNRIINNCIIGLGTLTRNHMGTLGSANAMKIACSAFNATHASSECKAHQRHVAALTSGFNSNYFISLISILMKFYNIGCIYKKVNTSCSNILMVTGDCRFIQLNKFQKL